jgi:hypothetical protein
MESTKMSRADLGHFLHLPLTGRTMVGQAVPPFSLRRHKFSSRGSTDEILPWPATKVVSKVFIFFAIYALSSAIAAFSFSSSTFSFPLSSAISDFSFL